MTIGEQPLGPGASRTTWWLTVWASAGAETGPSRMAIGRTVVSLGNISVPPSIARVTARIRMVRA
jgi:hypothetical protein